ncbi:MAG TPA: aldehyde reductase [Polyangia bacterium]|nr:aldehyde reductase [Polyangia bacterium]
MSTILVTGGSGFVASHCILQLLAAGHRVKTTVRTPPREGEVRAMLKEGGAADPGDRLSFFVADLNRDAGWADAVAGCERVLHVASPFPATHPRDENELIAPARDGALRVLRAARDAGVRRVVLTSSFAAVGYGRPPQAAPFDETSWTEPGPGVTPYVKSKTIAERTAWDFMAREGGDMEIATVNPVGIFGPVLGPDYATSVFLLKRMLEGRLPAVPRLYFGVVDVRDVADLHLRAMENPAARGERFLAVAGDFMSMLEIARTLRDRLGAPGRRVPTVQLPDWAVRALAIVAPQARQALPELGKNKNATSAKARRLLGWTPRSREDALVAAAESLIRYGLVKTGQRT